MTQIHNSSNMAAYAATIYPSIGHTYQIVRLRGEGMHSRMAMALDGGSWSELTGMADVWDCEDSITAFMAMVERFVALAIDNG